RSPNCNASGPVGQTLVRSRGRDRDLPEADGAVEGLDDGRVEGGARLATNLRDRDAQRPGVASWQAAHERVEGVDHGDQAALDRDARPTEASGKAAPIPALVVRQDEGSEVPKRGDLLDDVGAHLWMA